MQEVYIIVLYGQGDCLYCLLTKEHWESLPELVAFSECFAADDSVLYSCDLMDILNHVRDNDMVITGTADEELY